MAVNVANLKKPRRGKGAPPKVESKNLVAPEATGNVPIQLKISPELRREFRTYAAERDLSLNELFAEVWRVYKKEH